MVMVCQIYQVLLCTWYQRFDSLPVMEFDLRHGMALSTLHSKKKIVGLFFLSRNDI